MGCPWEPPLNMPYLHHIQVSRGWGRRGKTTLWKPGASVSCFTGVTSLVYTLLALLPLPLPVSAELSYPLHTLFSQPTSPSPEPSGLPLFLLFPSEGTLSLPGGYSFPLSPLRFLCSLSSLPLFVSPTGALMVPLCSLYFYPSDTPLVSFSLSVSPIPLLQYQLWVPISWWRPQQQRPPPGFSLPLAAPNERGVE